VRRLGGEGITKRRARVERSEVRGSEGEKIDG